MAISMRFRSVIPVALLIVLCECAHAAVVINWIDVTFGGATVVTINAQTDSVVFPAPTGLTYSHSSHADVSSGQGIGFADLEMNLDFDGPFIRAELNASSSMNSTAFDARAQAGARYTLSMKTDEYFYDFNYSMTYSGSGTLFGVQLPNYTLALDAAYVISAYPGKPPGVYRMLPHREYFFSLEPFGLTFTRLDSGSASIETVFEGIFTQVVPEPSSITHVFVAFGLLSLARRRTEQYSEHFRALQRSSTMPTRSRRKALSGK